VIILNKNHLNVINKGTPMLLLLKLKKPFYLLGALWVPLCLGMEAPTQEPSKKEEEQKIAPLQKLPGELVAYLSTF
jgi:hypothetical protein